MINSNRMQKATRQKKRLQFKFSQNRVSWDRSMMVSDIGSRFVRHIIRKSSVLTLQSDIQYTIKLSDEI